LMGLRGQDRERGYAMAALLVSLAVMSVLMSVALPVWRQQAQREKEAELAFRGEQYARAIALYRHKNANNFPPSIDVLVQGRYLRKKYRDPMTPDGEFRIIPVGGAAGSQGQQGGRSGTPPAPGRSNTPTPPAAGSGLASTQGGTFAGGGIMGVASKSAETSIRIYRGQTRYDMWPFTFNVSNRPGGSMPMAGAPGGRGERQPGPGGAGPGRGGPGRGGPGRGGPGRGGPGRGLGPGRGMDSDGRGFGPRLVPGTGGSGRRGGGPGLR
ncbi:MAG TPA: type II secretion system protein, partial [Vicinamibacterales bacterium]|nr:type II secretion system protein [Vicinamibacterales bacterium]